MKRFICSAIFVCIIALSVISFPAFGESNVENVISQDTADIQPTATPTKTVYVDAQTWENYDSMEEFYKTHERGNYNLIGVPDGSKFYIVPSSGLNAQEICNKVFEELGTPQFIRNY